MFAAHMLSQTEKDTIPLVPHHINGLATHFHEQRLIPLTIISSEHYPDDLDSILSIRTPFC